jgi:hypothetical protein
MNQAIDTARLFYTAALRDTETHLEKRAEAGEDAEATSSAAEPAPIPKFTFEELEEAREAIDEAEKWLKEKIEQVAGSPKNVDVPFRAAEIDQKGIRLQRKVMRLPAKLKVKPKKQSATAASPESSTSPTTTTSTSTAAEETETPNKRDEL